MPSLLPHEVFEVHADVAHWFEENQEMPVFDYVGFKAYRRLRSWQSPGP